MIDYIKFNNYQDVDKVENDELHNEQITWPLQSESPNALTKPSLS